MKRFLSILCALTVVLGAVVLPYAVNATSAVTLTPTYLHRTAESEVSGEKVYTTGNWDAGSITFDYEIQSGYMYYLSFDYMGRDTADNQVPKASTVASTDSSSHLNAAVAKAVSLNVPNSTSEYKSVWCELSGDDLLASGGKYLAINWVHLYSNSNFKNFKIVKIQSNANRPTVSRLHRVTADVENGEIVYSGGTYNAGSITFDYKIELGYTYFVSFDYMGHNYAEVQKPHASTVATATTHINSAISTAVDLGVPSSKTAWTNVALELTAEKLLASGGEYLAINWVNCGNAPKFKNFTIQRVKVGGDDGYIHPVTLKNGEVSKTIENGEIIYGMKTWACPSMVFDYQLLAGKEYKFEFEYKGHNYAQNCVPSIMAAESLDFQIGAALPEHRVSLGVPSSREAFTKCEVVFEADTVLASGGKYFTVFAQNLGTLAEFKNMKLSLSASSDLVGEVPLEVSAIKVNGGDYEVTETVENGETVYTFAKDWCVPSITFDFIMKKGKTYAVNFDYILTCGFDGNSKLEPSFTAVENKLSMASRVYENSVSAGLDRNTDWTNKTVIITADDIITETQRYLMFYAVGPTSKNGLKAKNFTITEIDPNELLSNGTFENGLAFWKDIDSRAELSTDAIEGNNSARLSGGAYSLFAHTAALQPNKNYKLSFQYKGTFSGLPNWGISKGSATMEAANLLHYGALTSTNEWKEHSVVFSTGDENIFAIMFQTGAGCDFFIDNVVLEETTETADETFEGKIPEYTETESSNRFWHYDADSEEANLVENGSFDGDGGNWQSLLGDGTITLHTTDNAVSGDKVLKFEAHDYVADSKNYMYINCKPNTEYLLSVWHRGENWSDTNKNDMRWGIADPITGKLTYTYRTVVRGWNITCWDNEWHRTTLKFNSGNNSVIALAYIGANSTAYIDDLQIFEYADRENGRPTVMTQEQPVIVDYTPSKTDCDDGDNLFKNSGFESSDISFWNGEDSLGYKGTVSKDYVTVLDWDGMIEIADSKSSHNEALYYTAIDKYTGHPLSTSYIKYIDVEPNTEYTFAVDYRIDEIGDGRFGLVSVNDFYPRIIAEWKTFSEESFDPDYKWQTAAYTFNSNSFDRVALVVQDKGGSAYLDNVRLFKVSAGKVQVEKVVSIESNKYTITDDYISIMEENVTVGEVLDTLKDKSEIRVFDKNGKEITDKNTIVGTGTVFKYMDGISVLDAVTVVLPGDLNGDGKCDSKDMTAILNHIIGKEILDEVAQKAADFNGDGTIGIDDAALISKAEAKEISGTVKSFFEGPEEVSANSEFEVVYYIDGKNLSAAEGVIKFDSKNLSFVSLTPEITSGWEISYSAEDGTIKFACGDMSGKNKIMGKTALFTVTFKAGKNAVETSALSVTKQKVSAGKNIVSIADIGYTPVAETTENNSSQSGNDQTDNTDDGYGSIIITDEEEGLSNNNRLASLTVKNAEITPQFDPETKNYEATVPFEIDELIVEAIAQDENATVTISDTELIYVGRNITKIVVHSESGLKRTYKIYTTRLAPENSGKTANNANGGMPLWGWILIGGGSALLIAAATFIILIIIKRKRKGEKK